MKIALCTTSFICNIFLGVLLYGFAYGHIERHAPDYLQEISSAQVRLIKK